MTSFLPLTEPELLVGDQWERSESIAFNGEGRLFVTANEAMWEIYTDGKTRKVAELYSNLGIAPIGDRDLLVADFGPTNAFEHDRNDDGTVWRITPEGEKSVISEGVIGDPNIIVMRKDGGMYGCASIAFGEGEFDHQSIYVSTTFNGGRGGNIWRLPIGIKGAKLNR